MDNKNSGIILRRLAGYFFDQASTYWYIAIVLEILAGVIGVIFSVFIFTNIPSNIFSFISIALLVISYILKLLYDKSYDLAETMRRQSVLSEGLVWPIDQIQFDLWCQEGGIKAVKKAKAVQGEDDYYSSKLGSGAERLIEMTSESLFYTKFLYKKINKILIIILIPFMLVTFYFVAFLSVNYPIIGMTITKFLFGLIPLIISIDIIGWILRISRTNNELSTIEYSLTQLKKKHPIDLQNVLREVMEYNCQTVKGIPIPNFCFRRYHSEITQLWKFHEGNNE